MMRGVQTPQLHAARGPGYGRAHPGSAVRWLGQGGEAGRRGGTREGGASGDVLALAVKAEGVAACDHHLRHTSPSPSPCRASVHEPRGAERGEDPGVLAAPPANNYPTVYLPKRILGNLAARLWHSNDGLPGCWGPSELKTVEKTKIH